MSNFNRDLMSSLSAGDERLIAQTLEETGFYNEVFQSFQGSGRGLYIITWIGIFVFCGVLFFAIWKFFHVETVRDQIMFAALAIMANSAQIALKLWFNMRLNRRAIIGVLRRLQPTPA